MNDGPLQKVIEKFIEEGKGVAIFMRQREKDPLELDKIKELESYSSAADDKDTETRDFGVGAQILRELGVRNVKLISANPVKKIALKGYGLDITEVVAF